MRILIVEDEYSLADIISNRLKKEKYIVDIVSDGEEGLYKALSNVYNLIILDIMLPSLDGVSILKEMRSNDIASKVIMLTAKSDIEDKINILNMGADDYITKPFHIEELIARVNVQLRINNTIDYIEIYDTRLYLKNPKLECISTNEVITISYKEQLILEYLMQNKDIIVAKEQIYDKVWGIDNISESNNLEVYISFIRKKLKAIGSNITIKAIRNFGYKIEVNNEKIKK